MKELLKDGGKLSIQSVPVFNDKLVLQVNYKDINIEFTCTEQDMEYLIDVACLVIFKKINGNTEIAHNYENELFEKHKEIMLIKDTGQKPESNP